MLAALGPADARAAEVMKVTSSVAERVKGKSVLVRAGPVGRAGAALGAGTRQALGMVLFRFVTNDADSPVIAYIDSGGFPFSGNGGNVDVAWNLEGILQAS